MNNQWEKMGDFNEIRSRSGTPLNRKVKFKSRLLDNHLEELSLYGYRDGGFQIAAKFKNRQSYDELRQAVVQSGIIEEPDSINRNSKIIRLHTFHLGLIGYFLNTLESIEPGFESVRQEVCNTLGISLTQSYSIPLWLIEGNFNQTQDYGPGATLNRKLTFKNTHLSHCIKKLELLGYQNGTFCLHVKARNDQAFEQLSQAIIQAGFEAPSLSDRLLTMITLNNIRLATYSQPINNFIYAIQSALPEIEIIRQYILNAIQNLAHRELEERLLAEAINESFENSHNSAPSLPLPNVGINESRVEGLQKKYESMDKGQIEIPSKFLCALMNIVMTTPVSVPQTPDVRYEQLQILHWLATNPTHPLTRAPLKPQQLIIDTKLQQEIEHFINDKENELSEPTVKPAIEPVIHAFKKRTRTAQLERLTQEANHFIGKELPAKRKRISRAAN